MRTRILALLSILFFAGCLKDESPSVKLNVDNTQYTSNEIMVEDLQTASRTGVPQAIFGHQNLVFDNYLEVNDSVKRTIIVINTNRVRRVGITPSLPFEEVDLNTTRSATYDNLIVFKDNNEIPIQLTRDFSKYSGDTASVFIPNNNNNVLISSSTVNALKYVLLGMSEVQVTHPLGVHKVYRGIFEKYRYSKGKWELIETVELTPINKGGIFNIPILL